MTYPITTGMDLAAWCFRHDVRFVRKDHSRMMRVIAWLLLHLLRYDRFMSHAWTTIGRTVYYPTAGPSLASGSTRPFKDGLATFAEQNRSAIEHEFHHVIQYERLWHLHSLLWLLFPLPVGLAWYRWRCERVAYLHQLRLHSATLVAHSTDVRSAEMRTMVDRVVNTLHRVYGWPWPKAWMRAWFTKRLRDA